MSCRLLLSAGGTGGHIFPALALADELKTRHNCSILFAAGKLSQNPYFSHDELEFKDVSCSSKLLKGMGLNCKGVFESIRIIKDYKPDAVIGFGSYYTLPTLAAAAMLGVPLLLHEANSIPGRVNRLFSPFAKKTWISFSEAKNRLSGSIALCKMPLRAQFKKGLVPREEALAYFKLDANIPTILIFGGSQGAKRINDLFSESVVARLQNIQIIHFTGSATDEEALSRRYKACCIPHYVKSFEKRIDLAWAAADMAITRAGASSLAEQWEFEVPGILIPYPEATDNHQDFNANDLVQAGLCYKLREKEISQEVFVGMILRLIQNRKSMKALFNENKNDTHLDLSQHIMEWIKAGGN